MFYISDLCFTELLFFFKSFCSLPNFIRLSLVPFFRKNVLNKLVPDLREIETFKIFQLSEITFFFLQYDFQIEQIGLL